MAKKKLTPGVAQIILATLREGGYAITACDRAGICEDTYYDWLAKGARGILPYAEFSESVKKVSAEAEAEALSYIVNGFPDDPKNAQWYLERRHPDRWGRRVVENRMTNKDGTGAVEIEVNGGDRTPEEQRAYHLRQAAKLEGMGTDGADG